MHLRARALTDLSPKLLTAIQQHLDAHKSTGLFVKLSTTSGKNEQKLEPLFTLDAVLEFATNAPALLRDLSNEYIDVIELVLMPWNASLDRDREFRVFLYNGRVTAIGQQIWSVDLGLRGPEAERIAQAIVDYCEVSALVLVLGWPHVSAGRLCRAALSRLTC